MSELDGSPENGCEERILLQSIINRNSPHSALFHLPFTDSSAPEANPS